MDKKVYKTFILSFVIGGDKKFPFNKDAFFNRVLGVIASACQNEVDHVKTVNMKRIASEGFYCYEGKWGYIPLGTKLVASSLSGDIGAISEILRALSKSPYVTNVYLQAVDERTNTYKQVCLNK